MTDRAALDRLRTAAGIQRRAEARELERFMTHLPQCHTDAMRARLAEQLFAGIHNIRKAGATK